MNRWEDEDHAHNDDVDMIIDDLQALLDPIFALYSNVVELVPGNIADPKEYTCVVQSCKAENEVGYPCWRCGAPEPKEEK